MPIPFTQYMLPHGRKVATYIDMSEDIELLAHNFIESGGYFESEILTTGHVSLTAGHEEEEDGDIAIRVVENGPTVVVAVEEIVREAHAWLAKQGH